MPDVDWSRRRHGLHLRCSTKIRNGNRWGARSNTVTTVPRFLTWGSCCPTGAWQAVPHLAAHIDKPLPANSLCNRRLALALLPCTSRNNRLRSARKTRTLPSNRARCRAPVPRRSQRSASFEQALPYLKIYHGQEFSRQLLPSFSSGQDQCSAGFRIEKTSDTSYCQKTWPRAVLLGNFRQVLLGVVF